MKLFIVPNNDAESIRIQNLIKENNILQQDNEIKKNTIMNYANLINEYNNLSWIKKLRKIFKKDNIKLLN